MDVGGCCRRRICVGYLSRGSRLRANGSDSFVGGSDQRVVPEACLSAVASLGPFEKRSARANGLQPADHHSASLTATKRQTLIIGFIAAQLRPSWKNTVAGLREFPFATPIEAGSLVPKSASGALCEEPSERAFRNALRSSGFSDRRAGAHRDPDLTAQNLGAALRRHLRELRQLGPQALVDDRYAKFRKLGPMTSPAPGDGA